MAEILALGISHYPPLHGRDDRMSWILKRMLQNPKLPEELRTPAGWPEAMRAEWGNDEGMASAARHRAELVAWMDKSRAALDAFKPDFVLIWGDDQYENFKEDVVPAFCIQAYDDVEARPWRRYRFAKNAWGEDKDTAFVVRGHRAAAKHVASRLLEDGFDVAYAYRPLHHPDLAHAFLNTILLLDWDRGGFPYPCVPVSVNCYGRQVIAQQGGRGRLDLTEDQLDPPSPSPRRCMDLGATVARAFAASPWRVALVASSSWSHSFLTRKHGYLYPDVAADRRLFEALRRGDYETWRGTALDELEDAGQHEVLNWYCLAGAMEALGRKPDACDYAETWCFVAGKCIAVWKP